MKSETTDWHQMIIDLGYYVFYKSYLDREGEYWRIQAIHRKTKRCRSATDRMFGRSTEAVAEKLYKKLISEAA